MGSLMALVYLSSTVNGSNRAFHCNPIQELAEVMLGCI